MLDMLERYSMVSSWASKPFGLPNEVSSIYKVHSERTGLSGALQFTYAAGTLSRQERIQDFWEGGSYV